MQGDRSEPLADSSTKVSGIHHAENSASANSSKTGSGDIIKVAALRQILERDVKSADMKWSLFVAACQSYRYDSCLKPFPPQFVRNDFKDIDALREVVDKTPALPLLLHHLHDLDLYQTGPEVIDLLYWVLAQYKDNQINTVPKDEFSVILRQVRCDTHVEPPNCIFEVTLSPRSLQEAKWNQLVHDRKTLHAFHGSRIENFHSILHHGLQQHMNKNALFGHGIYLSSELSVSLPYSPMGYAWGRSVLGGQMSCVALCEMIDHPDVKCQTEEADKARAMTSDSIGGEVPKKYFVVVNSDLVRIRYLLVYCRQTDFEGEKSGSLLSWLGNHKLLAFLIGYVVLLASVGLSNNQFVQRYCKMLLHRAGY